MKTREELLKTQEYWLEVLQNEVYRMVTEHLEKGNITQSQFAMDLGVSKGYVSQVMNGNFNYTLKKLIELSLAVNKAPVIDFKNINDFINEDKLIRFEMKYQPFMTIQIQDHKISIKSGDTENSDIENNQENVYDILKVA